MTASAFRAPGDQRRDQGLQELDLLRRGGLRLRGEVLREEAVEQPQERGPGPR